MMKANLMEEKSAPRLHYGWLVVLTSMLGLVVGVHGVNNFTAGLFFQPLTAEFGWSLQQVSYAVLIFSHAIVIASPFAGRVIDRGNGRVLISMSTALAGAGFISLYFLTDSLMQFYGTIALIAVLGCFTTPAAYSKLISRWFERRLGLALGLMMSGVGISSALLPAFALWLIEDFGWRVAYAGLGAVMIIMAPVLATFLRDRPGEKNLGVDGGPVAIVPDVIADEEGGVAVVQEKGMTPKEVLTSSTFWWLLLAAILVTLGFASLIVPMATLLAGNGLTASQIGLALGGMGIANFVARLMFGWLLDHFDPIYLALVIWTPAAFCILLLGNVQADWIMMLIPVIVGFGLGAELDLLAYLTRRYFGLRSMGLIYSILYSAALLSGGWGTVGVSRLLDMNADQLAVRGLFASILVGCLILLWIRRIGRYYEE